VTVSAVIFDMDGLMLDTERIALVVWRQAAADLGFALDDDVAERMVGRTSATNRLMLQMHFGDRFSYEDLATLADTRYRETLARDGVPRKDGLVELLDLLAAREVSRAVATSTASELARHKLEQAGVARYFDVIVGGNDVAHGKPAPDIFLRAAEQLGKLPAECVALEDSGPGIHAASSAGMITILIPDGGRMPSEDTRERASFVADSLAAAQPIIERLIVGPETHAGCSTPAISSRTSC
jgi:HAD superfamily hydrolase (TIGR01509 family)